MTDTTMEPAPPDILVRPFRSGDAKAFRRLNEEWIETHFRLEAKDQETLGDPEGTILASGGQILMAVVGSRTVGCIGLISMPDGGYEIAKMAVTPESRGIGVGRRLLHAAIAWAQARQAPCLYLESNARLTPALRLYESVGFRHLPPGDAPLSLYARADVFMVLSLKA